MKKSYQGIFIFLAMMLVLPLGLFITDAGAAAAEKVQYGGTLTYLDRTPTLNPMTWDIADWNWKHGYDTGFYMEHLLMGDLQKGPRGTKKFNFQSNAWIPPDHREGRASGKMGSEEKSLAAHLSSPQRDYVAGETRGHEGPGIRGR